MESDMTENERALIRWVKGADKLAAPSGQDSVPVHPQLKAEHFSREWQAIWCPHDNVNPAGILPLLSWIPAQGMLVRNQVFQMELFARLAKQAAGKAPGPDGWRADSGFCFLVVFILHCPCCGARYWMLYFASSMDTGPMRSHPERCWL